MKKILLILLASFLVLEPYASGMWLFRKKKEISASPPVEEYHRHLKEKALVEETFNAFKGKTNNLANPYFLDVDDIASYGEVVDGFYKKMTLLSKHGLVDKRFPFRLRISDDSAVGGIGFRGRGGNYFSEEKFKDIIKRLGKYSDNCLVLELYFANVESFGAILKHTSGFKNLWSLSVGGVSGYTNIRKPKVYLGKMGEWLNGITKLKKLKFGPLELIPGRTGKKTEWFKTLGSVSELHFDRVTVRSSTGGRTNLEQFNLEQFNENFKNLFRSLQDFPQLKLLNLTKIEAFDDEFLVPIAGIRMLETLRLEELKFVSNKGVKFLRASTSLKNVEFYNLEGIKGGIVNILLRSLLEKGFERLEGLTFFECPNVPIERIGDIKYLKKLHFFQRGVNVGTVTDMLSKFIRLDELYLGGFNISFESVLGIAKRHSNLRVLSIPYCPVTVANVRNLAKKLSNLRTLYVSAGKVKKEDAWGLNKEFKKRGLTVNIGAPHWA